MVVEQLNNQQPPSASARLSVGRLSAQISQTQPSLSHPMYPYADATNSGNINILVTTSYDSGTTWMWSLLDAVAVLPDVGPWATVGSTWAPDVIDRGNATFLRCTGHPFPSSHLMLTYFCADYTAESFPQNTHCTGAATSTNPVGPYTPQAQPIAFQTAGGAIDPAWFQNVDGQCYVVYKVDGSRLGGRGPCGNANEQYSAPVMLQTMEADALTPTGSPVQVLDRSPQDGPLVEALILILPNGTYVLTYSSNCYNTDLYDITYATAPFVSGPFTKASPLLATGNDGLTGSVEATPTPDSTFMVFRSPDEVHVYDYDIVEWHCDECMTRSM